MRAFPVRLPSGARYWTVLDENLAVVAVADGFLRQVRFGRDGAEATTKSYAYSIALFLRWCGRTGRTWQAGVEHLELFMTWLRHAGTQVSGVDAGGGTGQVLTGPGAQPGLGGAVAVAVAVAFDVDAAACPAGQGTVAVRGDRRSGQAGGGRPGPGGGDDGAARA